MLAFVRLCDKIARAMCEGKSYEPAQLRELTGKSRWKVPSLGSQFGLASPPPAFRVRDATHLEIKAALPKSDPLLCELTCSVSSRLCSSMPSIMRLTCQA